MIYIILARLLRWHRRLPASLYYQVGDAYWRCLRALYGRPCRICGGNRSLCLHEDKYFAATALMFGALIALVWGAQ